MKTWRVTRKDIYASETTKYACEEDWWEYGALKHNGRHEDGQKRWRSDHMWNTKGRSIHTSTLTFQNIAVRSINTRNTPKGNAAVNSRGNGCSSCCKVSSPKHCRHKSYLLFLIFDHTWKAFQINTSTRSKLSIMYIFFCVLSSFFWKSIEMRFTLRVK